MGIKFKLAAFAFAAIMSFSGLAHAGISHENWPVNTDSFSHVIRVPANTLENCCPRPKWWDSVDAPIITTKAELLAIWQNRELSKKIKAKVLYQAIRDFDYKDDDIVATAISLYPYVDGDYPHLVKMLEYGVGRFFNHNRSLVRYKGEVGDTSAGLVRKLARIYIKDDQAQNAAALISTLVRGRGHEINHQLLEHLSLALIDALTEMGKNELAFSVASYAIDNYDGDWEKQLKQKRDGLRPSISMSQQILLSFPNSMIFVLFGFVAAILMIGVFLLSRRVPPNTKADKKFHYGRNPRPETK